MSDRTILHQETMQHYAENCSPPSKKANATIATFLQVWDQWCLYHKTDPAQSLSHLLWDQQLLQLFYREFQPKQIRNLDFESGAMLLCSKSSSDHTIL